MLAQILAKLGQSGVAANLRVIAEAVRTGTVGIGPDLFASLRQACGDIALMRRELIRALVVKPE